MQDLSLAVRIADIVSQASSPGDVLDNVEEIAASLAAAFDTERGEDDIAETLREESHAAFEAA